MNKFLYNWRKQPTHCRVCGDYLEIREKAVRFDGHSGEPVIRAINVRCPAFRINVEDDSFRDNGHDFYSWQEKI